jgi:hypothetical protein
MNNMMLIHSQWKDGKTFKMIPTTEDCPYLECIYDNQVNVLAVVSTLSKDTFHMVPKLDANGDAEPRKTPGRDGVPYKQERRTLETYNEYYIENKEDVQEFIKLFAINADKFDFAQYMVEEKK